MPTVPVGVFFHRSRGGCVGRFRSECEWVACRECGGRPVAYWGVRFESRFVRQPTPSLYPEGTAEDAS